MYKNPIAYRYKYDDEDSFWNYKDDKDLIHAMVRVHHIKVEPPYSDEYVSILKKDIEILSKEWTQVAMALGKATREIHELMAENKELHNKVDSLNYAIELIHEGKEQDK